MAKRLIFSLVVIMFASPGLALEEKFWKGAPYHNEFSFSLLPGMGVLDSTPGFATVAGAAKKILHQGFIPDVNDQVFVEIQMGPLFLSGGTAIQYSAHLRWDFHRDEDWSFYALGGMAGHVTGSSLGNRTLVYPRFGIGALWNLFEDFSLRGELSRELIALGVSVSI